MTGRAMNEVIHAARMTPPDRVISSIEGGVGLYWFSVETLPDGAHRRYGWIECDNEGAAGLVCDRSNGRVEAWDIDITGINESIDRIVDFVGQVAT